MDFLSPEWLARLDELVSAATPPPGTRTFVLQNEIDGTVPTTYHFAISEDSVRAHAGAAAEPDIVFHMSRETAAGVATATTSAHEAFILGSLRLTGDPQHLIDNAPVTSWLHDVMAPLREQTTY